MPENLPKELSWTNFTEKEILNIPEDTAGVYAIAISENDPRWVYVGESSDLQDRIWRHLFRKSDQSRCILEYAPKRVGFKEVSGDQPAREKREAQLIWTKFPYCNKVIPASPPDKRRAVWESHLRSVLGFKKTKIILMSGEKENAVTGQRDTLRVGYLVALTLREGAAPLRCCVGEIAAIDDRGLRMTLLDGSLDRLFISIDLFVPWSNIESCLVSATESHVSDVFLDETAPQWQALMNDKQEDSQE
ncbi:MAG: GIY-YIG nuclease family protein [Gemmatimonadetes bacterium]|nr:GIY-YIG nuclease family protein [Gemmatimonadota bacterium]